MGSVERCEELPTVINPLSVSVQPNGKKRLILDLRSVNLHLYKQKVVFDNINTVLQYLEKDDYMFSFDLKSGYHHVEIFYPHTQFLGFSWIDDQGKLQFFKFKALPFGLSSAPYIFTKLLRPVVAYWRRSGIKKLYFFR